MAFYKREGEELLQAPTFVVGPGIDVSVENHSEHTYPIEGWHWFDTLDEAMTGMISPQTEPTCTKLQAKLAIAQLGMASDFLALKASLDPVADFVTLAFIDDAQVWKRTDPTFNAITDALGKSEAEKDQFFTLARTL